MRLLFAIVVLVAISLSLPALAGPHTNERWSSEADGDGVGVSSLSPGKVAYYNFTSATNSPILGGAASCQNINTRFILVSGTAQTDLRQCDAEGSRTCSNLPNGTDITASTDGDTNLAPDGGTAAALQAVVDSISGEGEWEVSCGGSR